MTTKEKLEKTLESSSIKPVMRTKIDKYDVFIADGFVAVEHYPYIEFATGVPVYESQYPGGCYATIWYTDAKTGGQAGISICEVLHDIESLTIDARQKARVNASLELARRTLTKSALH